MPFTLPLPPEIQIKKERTLPFHSKMRSGVNVPKFPKTGKGPKKNLHNACEPT